MTTQPLWHTSTNGGDGIPNPVPVGNADAEWVVSYVVKLSARYIPGRCNVIIADQLSPQGQVMGTEWSLYHSW